MLIAICRSVLIATLWLGVAAADVPAPTVTGPITGPGSPVLQSTAFALAPLGYAEEEFFLEGTATAYSSAAPLGGDGQWTVAPASTAAYRTRIVVRRPANPSRFNGTVVVEWLNVSAGLDASPDWIFAHTLLMREGYAWVGVSAQKAGIENTGDPLGLNLSLKAVNPARYGALDHPGDSFSYDIYSQVAAALHATEGVRPLGLLAAERLIAVGESQSASRLVTYVNAVHPLAGVYDGYLIHSRSGGAAALSQSPEPLVSAIPPVRIRDDLDVPVLTFQTETDLIGLGYLAARQPDGPLFRLWEVAGTAHADFYLLVAGPNDEGPAAADTTYVSPPSAPIPGVIECDSPINIGPQHYALSAAISQLDGWVRTGRAPRRWRRLVTRAGALALDRRGNAIGGVRTPQVDAPIAALSGLGQTGATFCFLFGTTTPLEDSLLLQLYRTQDRYVRRVERALTRAVRKGAVLAEDAPAILDAALASGIP